MGFTRHIAVQLIVLLSPSAAGFRSQQDLERTFDIRDTTACPTQPGGGMNSDRDQRCNRYVQLKQASLGETGPNFRCDYFNLRSLPEQATTAPSNSRRQTFHCSPRTGHVHKVQPAKFSPSIVSCDDS